MKLNENIRLTCDLIKFKTITGNLKESSRCLKFIENYIKTPKIHTVDENKNGYPSLMLSNKLLKKNSNYDLILHGHIDVIPAEDNQFKPFIKNGKIYGRGSLDMKSGVAVITNLLKNFTHSLNNRSLLVMLTSDEEIGGNNGTKYLLDKYKFRSKMFITAEGETDYLLKTKQKGILQLKLIAYGKKAHSSYAWLGDNANVKLIKTYQKIHKLFPKKYRKGHWYSTINLGLIKGGNAINTIPNYSEATLDIRFTEKDWKNHDEIINAIKRMLPNNVKVEEIMRGSLMNTNNNDYYVKSLHKTAQKRLHKKNSLLFNNHGSNDARFAAEHNIPAIGFGPTGKNYHSDNEWVSIKSLEIYYKILKDFLQTCSK